MAKNWALVIGINAYNPLNFAALKYAKQDAERLRDFFQEAGFEVCFFADDSAPLALSSGHTIPTQPTYGNLITFLQDRFHTPFLDIGDNCWFFFAGHGERHQDRDYLMPMDANSRGTEVIAGLTVSYIEERLSRCGADNVIMILDACRNEISRGGIGIGNDIQKGLIKISSCQPTQKSWEIEELEQGAFTYALLEALQPDGERYCATVEQLGIYLKQRVPDLCQQYGKVPLQIPRISVDPIEKQHFILLPQYAQQEDIDQLKLDAYRLKQNNPTLAEQICIRLNALAMGKDLELIDLLVEVRSEIKKQINVDDLSSERFNAEYYSKLRDLLVAKDWKAADQETAVRMCEVMNRQNEKWLRIQDINEFPIQDLRNINNLWVKYSNGKFGFSVQKEIWRNYGSPSKPRNSLNNFDWNRFGVAVGWRTKGILGFGDDWIHLPQMTYSLLSAPSGHLPTILFRVWRGAGQLSSCLFLHRGLDYKL